MALFAGATQYGFLVDRHNTALDYFGGGPKNGTGMKSHLQFVIGAKCSNSVEIRWLLMTNLGFLAYFHPVIDYMNK